MNLKAKIDEFTGLSPTWDDIVRLQGGRGAVWGKHKKEQLANPTPDCNLGRWLLSKQTDEALYQEPIYLYCMLFSSIGNSSEAYDNAGALCAGETVYDVGGTYFSALRMIDQGVKRVFVCNKPGPQQAFVDWMKHEQIESASIDSIKADSTVTMIEFLEHFREPMSIFDLVCKQMPNKLIVKSSFCTAAYGHYNPVFIDGVECHSKLKANKAFYKSVESRGWKHSRLTYREFNKQALEIFTCS
jgi:hypothetical protein